jgi:hypothetical protein
MLTRVEPDDPAQSWRPSRAEIEEYRNEERMEIERRTKPATGEVHQIYWHPKIGDCKHSNVYVTVAGISDAGVYARITGQAPYLVTMEQWGRMVNAA